MLDDSPLQAHDIMTSDVLTVFPHTSIRWAARLMSRHDISALPVVDDAGRVVGIVSEGDLLKWADQASERQAWWLDMLAEGFELAPDFLDAIRSEREKVRNVMSGGVVSVQETALAREIAALMVEKKVKRVVVLRDGKLVGIVSRADLVRAMAVP